MYLYLLILLIILLFFISLFFTRDFFSPSSIICLTYLFSLGLASLNVYEWKFSLSSLTFNIVFLGIISFFLGCLFCSLFRNKKYKKNIENDSEPKLHFFNVSKLNLLILLFVQLLTFILNFYYVQKIAGTISLSNIGEVIGNYRLISAYSENAESIPGFVIQMVKFSNLILYFITIIFINNNFYNKNYNNNEKNNNIFSYLIVSFIINSAISLLSGGRYNLISNLISIFIIYTFFNRLISDNNNINFKSTIKTVFLIFALLFVFSSFRSVVGRTNDSDFVSYISSYFGGSVPLLNRYLEKNPSPSSNVEFGYETFYPVHRFLNKFGISKSYRRGNQEFLTSGSLIGNVYTSFKPMYIDFGIIGILFLQFMLGFIWQKFYNYIKVKTSFSGKRIIYLVFYSMLIVTLFLHSYSEGFYSLVFSPGFFTQILYSVVIYLFIFKFKLVFKYNMLEG